MVMMLLPLLLFFVGLFSVDQYRTTLIRSEFTALERQGFTLARSLALAEAERDIGAVRRRLSHETMDHLLPLVGYGTKLRARVFQPNGKLLADTAQYGRLGGAVSMERTQGESWLKRAQGHLNALILHAAAMLGDDYHLPQYRERARQHADNYVEVISALGGDPKRQLRRDRRGNMVLSVAVPIQDLRLVRGALLVSVSGGKIEKEIAEVNIAFIQLFGVVLMVTIGLSVYLARSITTPITYLAREAEVMRKSRDLSARIQRLPQRRDEIGRLSESLIDLTDELQQRMAATAGFAADVAHELKNPLSSLRSAAETISHISDPKQQQKLMEVILKDVARLDRLISDISQASRVDNEIVSHSGQLIDLRKLLDSFVQTRQATTESHILLQNIPDSPIEVVIHDGRIVQVLDNLLSNAISFAPEDTEITFDLRIDERKNLAILDLQDRGPGIPTGRLEAIFDRFYSERLPNEAFGEHSGLGLSIARQIIRGHGGELTASNRDGACFTMSLPLAVQRTVER